MTLDEYESRLLQLLWSDMAVENILKTLRTDTEFADYHAYAEQMEPHMLEVAAWLVKKWSVPKKD